MFLIMAGSAESSAVPDVIPQLRESIRVLDVMCHCSFCPAPIPGTFLAQISGSTQYAFAPDLMPARMVIHF
jgi:hypothetical protein